MPTSPAPSLPTDFLRALRSIEELRPRTDVSLHRIPAPGGLAPHSAAFAATVSHDSSDGDGSDEAGTARLVILFDPHSQEGWSGPFRIVSYFQAPLEAEFSLDPLLPDVAWSWLTDSLDARHATYDAVSGTVTRILSRGYGELASDEETAQVEIRASWSPRDSDAGRHVEGWADALCLLTGTPPAGEGVSILRR